MNLLYPYKILVSFLLFLFLIIIFNICIDPNYYFSTSKKFSYQGTTSERMFKARLFEESNFEGLIFGDSKVTYIQVEGLKKRQNITVLNLAFSGGSIEEIYEFIFQKKPKSKLILIGLSDYMFNKNIEQGAKIEKKEMFDKNLFSKFQYSISSKTTLNSFKSIGRWLRGDEIFYEKFGSRNAKKRMVLNQLKKSDNPDINHYEKKLLKNFSISHEDLDYLEEIQNYCNKNNIKVYFFINPNRKIINQIRDNILLEKKNILRNEIKKRVNHLIIETEKFDGNKLYFKSDTMHYLPTTGEKILEILFKYIKLN